MLNFLMENLATTVIALIVALIVGAIAIHLVRKQKKDGGCPGGCDGCPNHGACHPK